MARTATAGSTPDSLQRLTEMPAAQQHAPLSPRSLSAATPGRAAQESTSDVAPDALPSLDGYPEPDARSLWPGGLPGINSPEGPSGLAYEPAAMQLSFAGADAEPVEPPEVTAAVGRSIQRTLASDGAASAAGGGSWSSPDSRRPTELGSPAAGPTAQAGGRGPVNIQRSAASLRAFPQPVRQRVGASGPAVLALAGQPTYRTGGDSAATRDATVQRDAADAGAGLRASVPGPGVGSIGGPSIAASESSSDTQPSVQTDAGSPPAVAAQPVPGAATNASVGKQAPGASAATPEQLEELAKRLTGPLIRRIKSEMLLDRERRGLRTDVI
jgi:hypothetical protein